MTSIRPDPGVFSTPDPSKTNFSSDYSDKKIRNGKNATTTEKISAIVSTILPHSTILPKKAFSQEAADFQNQPFQEVQNFIALVKRDFRALSLHELENGLYKALAQKMTDPQDKTTLLMVAEKVAQSYIQAKNFKFGMAIRMRTAQILSPTSPLADISLQLQHEDPKFGLHLYPVDTFLFKNHFLSIQRQTFTDGRTHLHLEAKLNHLVRAQLEHTLQYAAKNPKEFFDALPSGFCQAVRVTQEDDMYYGRTVKEGRKFEGDFSTDIAKDGFRLSTPQMKIRVTALYFEGIGKVKIGNSSHFHSLYNRISIDLDPKVSEKDAADKLNVIFAALGLGAISSSSREEDTKRIKILQLSRAFYPKETSIFEKDLLTFEESIENLRNRISGQIPGMKETFKYYLDDHPEMMYQQEVYPGQFMWAIDGLAQKVKDKGGMGLMAGMLTDRFEDAAMRFASILISGALSAQDRFQVGMITLGISNQEDLRLGGAESIFARLVTANMPSDPDRYPSSGKIRILYDLKLIERGGFAYAFDNFGRKTPSSYQNRSSILELTDQYLKEDPTSHLDNEVCIRNRIPPQFVKGVLVTNEKEKNQLLDILTQEGLITQNDAQQKCINGIPIDQFIHVGDFKAEYWD